MDWIALLCYFSLFHVTTCMIETLDKIEDLQNKTFGHRYPRHGLLLLHWLANHISISNSDDILLHFNPARQDYGFRYHQSTSITNRSLPLLDDLSDRTYYSLGSLSLQAVRTKLPPYVTQDYYNALNDLNRDLDRIVLRVHRTNPSRAEKVYIAQSLDYDPVFEISSKLLSQIKILSTPLNLTLESHVTGYRDFDDPRLALFKDDLLYHLKHTDQYLQAIFKDPGLRWLLILAGYDIDNRYHLHRKTWFCSADEQQISKDYDTLCEGPSMFKIEVKSTENGYARIVWRGLPKNILKMNTTIALFSSDTSSNLERFTEIIRQSSGSYDTYLPLNSGIQPRLVVYNFVTEYGFIGLRYSVIWRGPQFDETNRVIPTEITGYNASLQLYTIDGYVCARLYIKKSFTAWKNEFGNSWVSFYFSHQDLDHQYEHYQWVTEFTEADHTEHYLIYEYQSSMSIRPGVQARFMFSRNTAYFRIFNRFSSTVKACTVSWESKEE